MCKTANQSKGHLGDVAENSTTLSRQLLQPVAPSHRPCQPKNSSIRSVKSNFLPPGFSPNGGLAQVCQPAKRLAVFVGTAVEAVPLNNDLDIRTTHGQAKSLRAPRLVHCGSCIYRPYQPHPTSLGTINLYTYQSHCQRAARHKGAWKSVAGSFVETMDDIEDK